jgi:putative transposase
MSYGIDLRTRVVKFVSEGGSRTEASDVYGVSRKTIYHWLRRPTLSTTPKATRESRINKAKLVSHVTAHPDALLRERAGEFGVTPSGMWRALRKLGMRKKNDAVRGNKPQ